MKSCKPSCHLSYIRDEEHVVVRHDVHAAPPERQKSVPPILLPGDLGVGVAGGGTFEACQESSPDGDVMGHLGRKGNTAEQTESPVERCVQRLGAASVGLTLLPSVSSAHCLFVQRRQDHPHQNQEQGFLSAADCSCRTGSSYFLSRTQGCLDPFNGRFPETLSYCLFCGDVWNRDTCKCQGLMPTCLL